MSGRSARQLIIEPICGLGNRLHALATAQRLADLNHRELVVIWANNHPDQASHSNCALDDLFDHELAQAPSFDAIGCAPLVRFVRYPRLTPWKRPDLPGAIRFNSAPVDLTVVADAPAVGITTFAPLCARGDRREAAAHAAIQFLRKLKPRPWIDEAVQTFRRVHFQAPMLGIHIRRGDHGAMLARAGVQPTAEEDFWAYVEACLSSRPELRVFCASDDVGVKNRFVQRFADRACTYDASSLDRATTAGVQCALIDLLLLGRTDFMCGTRRSTFMHTAALLSAASRSAAVVAPLGLAPGIRNDPKALGRVVRDTLAALDVRA